MIPRRIALVIAAALVLQICLLGTFSFDGARPDVMILVALAVGHLIGPDEGALTGFAAGLAYDVFLTTPFGFGAFVYLLAGLAAGRLLPTMSDAAWWTTALLLAAASGVAMFAQGLVGELIGLETLQGPSIGTIVMVVALVNLVMAPAAVVAVRWARLGGRSHRRRSVYA